MDKKTEIIKIMREQGLLPLFYHHDKTISANILKSIYKAGVRVIEFTNRGPDALATFAHLKKVRDQEMPGLYLAAGTIKNKQHLLDFIDAGADFIISPGLNEEVCKTGNSKNIFWIPGCMTPSEIIKAEEMGAELIKLFPGNLLGTSFLNAIRELFPNLLFIPTGGVKLEQENLTDWFKSGVIAVGAGSTLINKNSIEAGEFSLLEKSTKAALELIASVRASLKNKKSL